MGHALRFDFPDGAVAYAGICADGGLGFAPSLATALIWDDPDKMAALRTNGYGGLGDYARVVTVSDGIQ